MNKLLLYSSLFLVSFGFGSCENFFDMRQTNEKTEAYMEMTPKTILSGYVSYGYLSIPSSNFGFYTSSDGYSLDTATDNAVGRYTSNTEKMATQGSSYYTKDTNPLNKWNDYYQKIRAINDFFESYHYIENENDVTEEDKLESESFIQRSLGECYFNRAYNHFELLRRHGGYDNSGVLMGIPYMFETMDVEELEYLPRNTFEDCIKYIVEDCDAAMTKLPHAYDGTEQCGLTASSCTLNDNLGRASIPAAMALKSRVLLYAASPAFNPDAKPELYEAAAQAAADLIKEIGSTLPDVYDISDIGTYKGTAADKISQLLYNNDQSEETIMPRVSNSANTTSVNQFPPGTNFRGKALNNPSQNLVDAFPMQNGYPITHVSSGYEAAKLAGKQYLNRDARFYMTVMYNKQKFRNKEIQIYPGGADYLGAEYVSKEATRTGYFLRKWTSSKVQGFGTQVKDYHPIPVFRKAEAFLNYAEAVLEADGMDGTTYGMSARQAIGEVRARAGIGTDRAGIPATIASDEYLASINSIEDMRELIRNERRIELCFEDCHRFFDLRRWKADLNTPVKGIFFADKDDNIGEIRTITVDGGADYEGKYEDYMYYGPVPNIEVNKNSSMTQNKGWE